MFYENNYLNKAVCEFLYKLLSASSLEEKLNEYYTSFFINDFLKLIEKTNSYISHNTELRDGSGSEFFTDKGLQIGRRFDIQIETVKKKDLTNFITDEKSIFKEPYAMINTSFKQEEMPEGNSENVDGEDGSGSSGGGGFSGGGGGFSGGGDITAEPLTGGGEATPDVGDELPQTEEGLPVDFGTTETSEAAPKEETTPEEETK